jgi:glycosyltransferase involved in cell wall biosynthesis
MRIFFLTKRQYTGKDLLDDAYGRLYEIPLELARRGHQVQGLCLSYRPRDEGNIKGPAFDGTPVDWQSMNMGHFIVPGIIRYLRTISEVLYRRKPDCIVGCSDSFQIIIAYTMARRFRLPFIADLYDNFESFGLTRFPGAGILYRRAISRAPGIACVSKPLEDYIRASYSISGILRTVENGVPAGLFHGKERRTCRKDLNLPVDATIIGTAGAIGPSRGIEVLFKAFRALNAENPKIHLALAGRIEKGTVLPEGESVHFLGNLKYEQVPIFLNALDVGIISNLDTSFGRYCFPQKAYEMIACGIPVAAARVGVLAELFKSNEKSLFSPGDVRELVRTIKSQLTEPSTLQVSVPTWTEISKKFETLLIDATNA